MESVEAPMEFVVEGYAAVFTAFVGAAPIIVERAFASPNAKVRLWWETKGTTSFQVHIYNIEIHLMADPCSVFDFLRTWFLFYKL